MQPSKEPSANCTVVNAAKNAAPLQDAEICGPIERAVELAAKDAGIGPGAVSVRVEILSPHSLAATTLVDGHALPPQRVDVSDRTLGASSVNLLAQAIATQIAQHSANRS